MMDKCRICGEYKIEIFGAHRCGPSYQVVIIGNDEPPDAPFQLREQLRVLRVFSQYDMSDAVQDAVADYHHRAAEYSDNTTVGAMTWEHWQVWEAEHEDDDALLDPALLTWYDVTLRMEPAYKAYQRSLPLPPEATHATP